MKHAMVWRSPVLSVAAILVALCPGRAAAQSPSGCTTEIASLPYTISSNGVYCLKNTIFTALTSGAAITIGSSSVTAVLDLRGFAINNLAAGSRSTAIGVLAAGQSNVTVRNGRIQSFWTGITLDSNAVSDTYNNVVEDVHIDSARNAGIVIHGRAHLVRRCTVTRLGQEGGTFAVGILASGDGILVEGNVVSDSLSAGGRGISMSGFRHQVVGNRILNPQGHGLRLVGAPTAVYRDNLVTGAQVPYDGGIDAGNNQ